MTDYKALRQAFVAGCAMAWVHSKKGVFWTQKDAEAEAERRYPAPQQPEAGEKPKCPACAGIGTRTDEAGPYACTLCGGTGHYADPPKEPQYPCSKCGKLRTKAEGGTAFTVCDTCWDEEHPKLAYPHWIR